MDEMDIKRNSIHYDGRNWFQHCLCSAFFFTNYFIAIVKSLSLFPIQHVFISPPRSLSFYQAKQSAF